MTEFYPASEDCPALIKTEPLEEVGGREFECEVIVERVKSEADELLYADHEIKDELVIGPTVILGLAPQPITDSIDGGGEWLRCRLVLTDTRDELQCRRCGEWSITATQLQQHKLTHAEDASHTTLVEVEGRGPTHNSTSKRKKTMSKPLTKETDKDTSNKTVEHNVPASADQPATLQESDTAPAQTIQTDMCKAKQENAKSKRTENDKDNTVRVVEFKADTVKTGDKCKTRTVHNSKVILPVCSTATSKTAENDDKINPHMFICNDCNQYFDSKPKILQHIISAHNSIKDLFFRCEHCSYKATTKNCLDRHVKLHDFKRKHACEICLFRFRTNHGLKLHLSTKHEAGSTSLTCDECSYKCIQRSDMKVHMAIHTREKPFECNVCSYKCIYSSQLKQHTRTHTGEKLFACNWCSFKCNQSSYLKVHMRTHTGEKPFSCNVCSFKCIRSSNLKIHMKTHTGEKPFACNVCCYKCIESRDLKRHMKTHTGEKPFSCNVCSFKCNRRSYLKIHMKTHTGEKPFACKVCCYKCNNSSNFRRHMRTHTMK